MLRPSIVIERKEKPINTNIPYTMPKTASKPGKNILTNNVMKYKSINDSIKNIDNTIHLSILLKVRFLLLNFSFSLQYLHIMSLIVSD